MKTVRISVYQAIPFNLSCEIVLTFFLGRKLHQISVVLTFLSVLGPLILNLFEIITFSLISPDWSLRALRKRMLKSSTSLSVIFSTSGVKYRYLTWSTLTQKIWDGRPRDIHGMSCIHEMSYEMECATRTWLKTDNYLKISKQSKSSHFRRAVLINEKNNEIGVTNVLPDLYLSGFHTTSRRGISQQTE